MRIQNGPSCRSVTSLSSWASSSTYDETLVDGEVDRPPADDGDDSVHAEVEQQQEEGDGLHSIGHFVYSFRKLPHCSMASLIV